MPRRAGVPHPGLTKGTLPSPEQVWSPITAGRETASLALDVARLIRATVLAGFTVRHPGDRRPVRAIEAAEAYFAAPTEPRALHAAAVAKACTAARRDTLGGGHRVAEAARALAHATTRTADLARRRDLYDALAAVEEELIARLATAGIHDRDPSVRAELVALLDVPPRPGG